MDVKVGDQIKRISNKRNFGPVMTVGTIVTVKEIVLEGKVKVHEENGVWHLIYFEKLNKLHELWI